MANKTEEKCKNYFHVRLYNLETVKSIEELYATGRFDSLNELLGYAIGFGIEKLYLEFGKKKMLSQTIFPAELPQGERMKRTERQIEDIKVLLEDMFIMQSCEEAVLATLYNVARADIAGERVSTELMDKGMLSDLPTFFERIKQTLAERFNRRNTQKKED